MRKEIWEGEHGDEEYTDGGGIFRRGVYEDGECGDEGGECGIWKCGERGGLGVDEGGGGEYEDWGWGIWGWWYVGQEDEDGVAESRRGREI
jgi:hypothetical protein